MQAKIDKVMQVGHKLQDVAFHDVDVIDALLRKLEDEWKKLLIAVEKRSTLLEASRSFHSCGEKVSYSQNAIVAFILSVHVLAFLIH